jgi:phosphoribosylanthranilate isomerase
MIAGIRLKVCGITSLADAEFAGQCGADFLGFILHPKSPRHISLAQFSAMVTRLPAQRKVAVFVLPSTADLAVAAANGFDFFQVHFPADTPSGVVGSWAESVGAERLWLAPKLPPTEDVNAGWLPFTSHLLLDTFQAEGFGGSGRTGDWSKFARHHQRYPAKSWILAGGLNPENIASAVTQSGARFVDVNSGVESAPGIKDLAKLRRFVANLSVHRE